MTESLQEAPGFALDTSGGGGILPILPPDARLLWEDVPGAYVWGNLPEHALHVVDHPLGHVALVGDCFPDNRTIEAVVATALETDQPEILSHFPGAYTTIMRRANRVSVLRDVVGTRSVYFRNGTEGTIVSSKPSVVAGEDGLQPNLVLVAARFVLSDLSESAMIGNQSLFEGISRLRGGQGLRVTNNTDTSVYTYEHLLPDRSNSLTDAARNLCHALDKAIAARQEAGLPLSADESGGLDSGALINLVLQHIGDTCLPVFFRQSANVKSGDAEYVKGLVAEEKRLRLTLIDPQAMLEEATLPKIAQPEELAIALCTQVQKTVRAYYQSLTKHGAVLHLTGTGGDEVTGVGMNYLPDLIKSKQFRRLFKEGMQWARIYNTSPLTLWRDALLLSFRGPRGSLRQSANKVGRLDGAAASFDQPQSPLDFWQPTGISAAWLTPDARRMLQSFLEDKASSMVMPAGLTLGDFISHEQLHGAGFSSLLAAHYSNTLAPSTDTSQLSLQSPFLDHNVVRAAFSVTAALKGSPYEFKPILQATGILPESLSKRKTKGDYDPELQRLHLQSLHVLSDILDTSMLVQLGVVDPKPVHDTLRHIDTLSNTEFWALTQLLTTELWLQNLKASGHNIKTPFKQAEQAPAHTPTSPPDNRAGLHNVRYGMPGHVHAVATDGGSLVALNRQKDFIKPLSVTQSHTLRALAETGDMSQTFDRLCALYPGIDRELLRADMVGNTEKFVEWGLLATKKSYPSRQLATRPSPVPDFLSDESAAARPKSGEKTSIGDRLLTAGVFAAVIALNYVAPAKRRQLLQYVQAKHTKREATPDEALSTLETAQRLTYLGRIACLEAPYTAALTLALRGKHVDWHMGARVSPPPFGAHSWITVNSTPIRSRFDGRVSGRYHAFF